MSEHNRRQKCTDEAECLCPKCCQCSACLFDRRSRSLYSGLGTRLKERRWKNGPKTGQVRIAKRDLPFTAAQFRAWLTVVLEDTPRCEYCRCPVSIATISPDHRIPCSRGGSLALANLRPSCKKCNSAKGSLLPGEFAVLQKLLATFTEEGRTDVYKRLRGGGGKFGKPKMGAAASVVKPALQPGSVLAFPPVLRSPN